MAAEEKVEIPSMKHERRRRKEKQKKMAVVSWSSEKAFEENEAIRQRKSEKKVMKKASFSSVKETLKKKIEKKYLHA